MKLSIVTTLYKSAAHIEEFHRRASAVAQEYAGDDYEIIMVDDGSPDNSLEIAIRLTENDSHLKVIELSRNFGHHKAIMTGIMHAQGEEVFLIDVDLEEEPEWLIPFAEEKKRQGADVVYGVQKRRKGGWFERWSGGLYYKIFNALCNIDHPVNPITVRLMTKKYVENLLLHLEQNIVFTCLCVITGFKQSAFVVTKKSSSQTTYSLSKKIALAFNTITSFSDSFLRLIFLAGLSISIFSFIFLLYMLYQKMVIDSVLDGWTSVMISVWFLSGVILLAIGIIGVYLSKIFVETKNRPYSIIRTTYTMRRIN